MIEDEATEENSEVTSEATETSNDDATKSTEKPASASLMATSEGNFDYGFLSDSTIEILGYNGSDTEIVIPSTIDGYTVTSIGEMAFYSCSDITSVTIPEGVTSIDSYAFYDCESLESLEIPESVEYISRIFAGCPNLKSINVDSNNPYYTSVNGVLYDKDMTKLICCPAGKTGSFVIPDSVTSIEFYSFYECSKITSITIPDSVTSIGYLAFSGCSNLTSIIIPDGVTSIQGNTFSGCSSLTSITIPDSVTSIGGDAFYECSSLTSITIPDSVASIGIGIFVGCSSLTSIEVGSNNSDYISVDGVLYDKDMTEIICCPVKKTGSFIIPDSVTNICEYAFYDCTGLTSITIPDGVASIGEWAFYNCNGLTSITIPGSVTDIRQYAFYNCNNLTSITMLNGVISIGSSVFACCNSLTNITLPDSVISIDESAFFVCSSLTNITIPDSVTSIGVMAFYGCDSLTGIEVSSNNSYYTSVDGVLYNKDMTEIVFCPVVKTGSFVIPDGVTSIANYAFPCCYNLTSIMMPDGVTNIGKHAFDCSYNLTSIIIPDSVTNIDEYAFFVCSSLADIYYTGTEAQWNSITFGDEWNSACPDDMVIHYNYTGVSEQTITASAASSTITGIGNTTTIMASTTGDGAITYSSSDTSVATVDSTGKVAAKGYGRATITVTAAATDGYFSASTTVTINVKLAKPTLKSATNTTSGVKVTWGAVTGATKYQVYRKTSGGSWAKLGTSTSTSYTDKTAKSGTTYYYTVRCMNSSGTYTSDYNTSGISKKYLSKGKISSLTNKSGGITIKWSKVTGASGYYIYRKTSSGSYSKIKTITSGSTLSYTDTKVKSKNGTTYVYKVVPYSGSTTGSFTAKTTVRLTGTSLSSVKNSSSKKMTVKWSKKSSITGYQIQYLTSSSFSSYKTVTVSGASKVSKVISSLTKNKTYYVRIRTYKTVSGTKYYSAWSSKKSVKIKK